VSREAVIVAGCRTPVGRAVKGTTRDVRPDEMAAAVIGELLKRTEGKLDPAEIDDVILGCAFPEGDQGLNMARPVALRAGLPVFRQLLQVCGAFSPRVRNALNPTAGAPLRA